MAHRLRSPVLPGLVLAGVLGYGALKLYGVLTRPAVPASVQRVIGHYAPGVEIGATVRDVRSRLPNGTALSFVPHLGWVGTLGTGEHISQLRLLLSPKDRERAADDARRVDAVELVTAEPGASTQILTDLVRVYPRPPRQGCLALPEDGNHRETTTWIAGDGRGGVSLVNDFGGNATVPHPRMVVVSLVGFAGPFDGGATLRGRYADAPCAQLALGRPLPPAEGDAAIAAIEDSLSLAFADAVAGAAPPPPPSAAHLMFGGDTLDACIDRDPGEGFEQVTTSVLSLALPRDFAFIDSARSEADLQATGYARFRWRGDDGSTLSIYGATDSSPHAGWTGLINGECDLNTAAGPLHVDLVNASVSGPDRVVRGWFAVPGKRALVFEGHGRSPERQAALLHALHTIYLSGSWDTRP